MKKLITNICLTITIILGNVGINISNAQTIDHVIQIDKTFVDIKIKIVDFLEDEKWKVVGSCSNSPTLKIQIVDTFEDKTIKIVDSFEDKKVCITGVKYLDIETQKLLGLID